MSSSNVEDADYISNIADDILGILDSSSPRPCNLGKLSSWNLLEASENSSFEAKMTIKLVPDACTAWDWEDPKGQKTKEEAVEYFCRENEELARVKEASQTSYLKTPKSTTWARRSPSAKLPATKRPLRPVSCCHSSRSNEQPFKHHEDITDYMKEYKYYCTVQNAGCVDVKVVSPPPPHELLSRRASEQHHNNTIKRPPGRQTVTETTVALTADHKELLDKLQALALEREKNPDAVLFRHSTSPLSSYDSVVDDHKETGRTELIDMEEPPEVTHTNDDHLENSKASIPVMKTKTALTSLKQLPIPLTSQRKNSINLTPLRDSGTLNETDNENTPRMKYSRAIANAIQKQYQQDSISSRLQPYHAMQQQSNSHGSANSQHRNPPMTVNNRSPSIMSLTSSRSQQNAFRGNSARSQRPTSSMSRSGTSNGVVLGRTYDHGYYHNNSLFANILKNVTLKRDSYTIPSTYIRFGGHSKQQPMNTKYITPD